MRRPFRVPFQADALEIEAVAKRRLRAGARPRLRSRIWTGCSGAPRLRVGRSTRGRPTALVAAGSSSAAIRRAMSGVSEPTGRTRTKARAEPGGARRRAALVSALRGVSWGQNPLIGLMPPPLHGSNLGLTGAARYQSGTHDARSETAGLELSRAIRSITPSPCINTWSAIAFAAPSASPLAILSAIRKCSSSER